MARHWFGGSVADWFFTVTEGGLPQLAGGASRSVYLARTGGDPVTDLLNASGDAMSQVTSGDGATYPLGMVPPYQGPDAIGGVEVTELWVDDGTGQRTQMTATDLAAIAGSALTIAQQAQATAQAALAAAGTGGGGAVATVNGKVGNVTLTAGDVAAVPTAGGGIIAIPNGDLVTQALRVRIPAGDRATAVDTAAYELNVGTDGAPNWRRVTFINEKGLPRVIGPTPSDVMWRIKLYGPEHTADAFQLTDLDNNPIAGLRPDGRWYGPNVGNTKVSSGTSAPLAPTLGDIWVDRTMSPFGIKTWTGSQWVLAQASTGAEPPPPPDEAPAFVDKTSNYANATTLTLTKPTGATLLAFLAWNAASAMTPPAGWTLADELVGASGRAGIWVADSSVSGLTWTHGAAFKTSGMILGYEACNVALSEPLLEDTSEGAHTAPAITPPMAPATILRLWWDKASTTSSITLPGGHTSRALQYGTGSSAPAIAAADLEVATTDLVAAATATFNANSAQAGGFSLALVAA